MEPPTEVCWGGSPGAAVREAEAIAIKIKTHTHTTVPNRSIFIHRIHISSLNMYFFFQSKRERRESGAIGPTEIVL